MLISYKGIRSSYRLGRVTDIHYSEDGLVRRIKLEYKLPSETTFRIAERSVHGVAVIVPIEELEDLQDKELDTNGIQ